MAEVQTRRARQAGGMNTSTVTVHSVTADRGTNTALVEADGDSAGAVIFGTPKALAVTFKVILGEAPSLGDKFDVEIRLAE